MTSADSFKYYELEKQKGHGCLIHTEIVTEKVSAVAFFITAGPQIQLVTN